MQIEVQNANDKMVTYVDTKVNPKVVDYSALCGKLDFIKKYECKTDAEKEAIDEAIKLIKSMEE